MKKWDPAWGVALLGPLAAAACTSPAVETAPRPEPVLSRSVEAKKLVEPGAVAGAKNVAGVFDFYVLSLSWSPQHCATRRSPRPDDPQCGSGRSFGFIVHGLWPQYVTGYPESCTVPQPVAPELAQRMLRIMPGLRLIQHEWDKHGTCSGLSSEQYFAQIETLWAGLQIPSRYLMPAEPLHTSAMALRAELLAANPALPADGSSVAVVCQGEQLQELRLCYGKDFRPRACTATVADSCPAPGFVIRPVARRQE